MGIISDHPHITQKTDDALARRRAEIESNPRPLTLDLQELQEIKTEQQRRQNESRNSLLGRPALAYL